MSKANNLKHFINPSQLSVLRTNSTDSEEKEFFIDKLAQMEEIIKNMPQTYEQDGKGDEAVAHLHYFRGGMDWYITEKDMEGDEGQYQAFGLANLGHGAELGYIAIKELIENSIEIDLFFEPKTLKAIKAGE